jgi:PilZ domain
LLNLLSPAFFHRKKIMTIRSLAAKFNKSIAEKLVPSRRKHTAAIKIWFDPEVNSELNREVAKSVCILGETVDISRSGLAFLVPAIRIQEKYLVGQERLLNVEIDLPNGKVSLQAMGRRYEKVGIHLSAEKFLVGVQIVKIDAANEEAYQYFLKNGSRNQKSSGSLAELGID